MADSYTCKGGRKTAGSNKPTASKESRTETRINPPAELPKLGNATSDKTEGRKKGRPKAENQALKDIPLPLMNQWKDEFKAHSRVKCPNSGCWLEFPSIYGLKYHYQRCQGGAISEKLTYSCSYCEAAFTSKTQLEKHRLWNHLDRPVPTSKAENKVPKAIGKSSGKKRPAESSACPTIHPKQAKMEKAVAQEHAENGECLAESRESKEFQIAAAEAMAAATPTAKSSSGKDTGQQRGSQASLQEEDPERMKHRRKQKTPKKFTGEQPSISGTFGLKGLVKAEDKAKAHRAKKLEGNANMEELKKKPPGVGVKKETSVHPPAANPEDQWQREISEKGEVSCPTCSIITRKTIVGLKKHMDVCQKLQDALKCQHCKKQFKSKAGLNYHTMAEHVSKGCVANFSSLMGYQYHQKRCGKQLAEADKPVFSCPHCGKKYKSKAGHDYHVRSEHTASVSPPDASAARGAGPSPPGGDCRAAEPVGRTELGKAGPGKPPEEPEVKPEPGPVEDFERTPSGRIRRTSAQVAVFHLQEIAEDELARDWTKRRMKDDLVPETKRLNYTRPGLPKLNPRLLENWKNEVKEKGRINCPNNCCEAIYSSVSGLKAHLANCNKGDHSVGKYRCLLCQKEFSSESGVKYHIIKAHSENWFRTSSEASRKKKNREQLSSSKEEKKKSTNGKKRGRKPKERPPEMSPKGKESVAAKTNHKKTLEHWEGSRGSPEGDELVLKPPSQRKGGASKMPEK
ncbi:zinc finger protein 512B isoform X2 [Catharus ustulatus]|uniref:Zinc finger protein 512B n=1 Tax=Catharus ustulatus TaxID=91951 RepID=A0A8C3Y4Q5_CATUS|nr:zinc finger protein 512B isoform X2 [Catharus ustulatus]XP_042635732.1 zinc finger protein 512B isoform X2 [Catharus ustulatus]